MKFKDNEHKRLFDELCKTRKSIDEYHAALFYLITLDTVCREHIKSIYDIEQDTIKPECIFDSWQTSSSTKTIRLAFNLWNGRAADKDTESASPYYTVDEIFNCEYAPYYWQAIQLRYPQYINE